MMLPIALLALLAGEDFARVTAPVPLEFPRDHGAHLDYRTEWWYFTGNVHDGAGREFGFQLTFFRSGLVTSLGDRTSRFATRDLWLAHFALTDAAAGAFFFDDRADRGSFGTAGAASDTLDVWLRDWRAKLEGGVIRLGAASGEHRLALDLRPLKPEVLHGERGYSRKGRDPGNASMYFSLPRCTVTGELATPAGTAAVEGSAWMDHEFGSSVLADDQRGWDWFSLQLDDGSELMLFQIRRAEGGVDEFSAGTLVRADGTTRPLSRADFTVDALSRWRSKKSGADYPASWRVAVPSESISLMVEPLLADQELSTANSTRVVYWEGAVRASGTSGGHQTRGVGYVELVGYAGKVVRF